MNKKDREYVFDKPRNVQRLLRTFFASLVFLLIGDFFIYKHADFAWEEWPEFFAVYGFVACVVLVLAAKYVLRPIVKRRENYYD
jgi:purine-cytosine permease-like protein